MSEFESNLSSHPSGLSAVIDRLQFDRRAAAPVKPKSFPTVSFLTDMGSGSSAPGGWFFPFSNFPRPQQVDSLMERIPVLQKVITERILPGGHRISGWLLPLCQFAFITQPRLFHVIESTTPVEVTVNNVVYHPPMSYGKCWVPVDLDSTLLTRYPNARLQLRGLVVPQFLVQQMDTPYVMSVFGKISCTRIQSHLRFFFNRASQWFRSPAGYGMPLYTYWVNLAGKPDSIAAHGKTIQGFFPFTRTIENGQSISLVEKMGKETYEKLFVGETLFNGSFRQWWTTYGISFDQEKWDVSMWNKVVLSPSSSPMDLFHDVPEVETITLDSSTDKLPWEEEEEDDDELDNQDKLPWEI